MGKEGGREWGRREGGSELRDMPVICLVSSLCWRRPDVMFTHFPRVLKQSLRHSMCDIW